MNIPHPPRPAPTPDAVPSRRARRGSALVLVLVAMVVLLVLSSAAMFGTMQELRTSRTLAVQQRAQAVAEYGMTNQLANWPANRACRRATRHSGVSGRRPRLSDKALTASAIFVLRPAGQ